MTQDNKTEYSKKARGKKALTQYNEIGKLQPQAIELEEAVLGAIILESSAYYAVNTILKQSSFYKEANGLIWKAITQLMDSKSPVDLLTIMQQLKKNEEFELVGGGYYVSSLTNNVATSANIEAHARIVEEQAIKREMIMIATNTISLCYQEKEDCFEVMEGLKTELSNIEKNVISDKSFDTISKLGNEFLTELENKRSGLTPPLIKSGLDELYGFANSDSIIVAARPGMGKTAFLLKAARQCIKDKNPCGIFSIEMSSMQLLTRLASAECEIDSEKIRDGKLENHEMNAIHYKIKELSEAKLYIDDTASIDIDRLCNKARKMKREHGIKILFIDYLGLITTTHYLGQKTNEVGYISRKIKQLAKELDIPIITLAQLSRKIEERKPEERMPRLSDLRDSGDIEQDADQVIFLFRPQYYKMKTFFLNGQEIDVQGKALIEYAKNRHGSLLTALVRFIGKYTDFRNDYTITKPNEQTSIDSQTTDIFK